MATLLKYNPERTLKWMKESYEKKDTVIEIVDKVCKEGKIQCQGKYLQ